jgi:hypothetical protein
MSKELNFEDGRIKRRYTEAWLRQGLINMNELPHLIESLVAQRREMVAYIEALHDKIDWILEVNKCCDIPSCFRAGCTSDHK